MPCLARRRSLVVRVIPAACWLAVLLDHVGASSRYMACGEGVPMCGVLALDTGFGSAPYNRSVPSVHGLWPAVDGYGNSACVYPESLKASNDVFPCYDIDSANVASGLPPLQFQEHEWLKHGRCAGMRDYQEYFSQ